MAANDPRRPDPRRDACEELAELLTDEEALRTTRLLQLTETLLRPQQPSLSTEVLTPSSPTPSSGVARRMLRGRTVDCLSGGEGESGGVSASFEDRPQEHPPGDTRRTPPPRAISIWQPKYQDGEWIFERPAPLPLGDHYAVRRQIHQDKPPKTTRICLFGESVAAGYLYAPRLTPATVLAAQLAHFAPDSNFEVIDLARTNERLAPLVETAERSLQLAPDQWVIFAGNNWNLLETPEVSPYFPSVQARQNYAQALRKGDLDGVVAQAADLLERNAQKSLRQLARLASENGIEVVLVIPESHLAGWEVAQPTPWLPGDLTAKWHSLVEDTKAHLRAHRATEAMESAQALLRLDGGRCSTGHRLLTRALLALGQVDAARQASQEAVDRSAYANLGFLGSPQATSAVQGQLRNAAAEHRFVTVDLPWIFAAHNEDELPGDDLFLDYCHLSSEGMRLAMAAIATECLRASDHSIESEEALHHAPPPALPPQAAATAHLGAAVHGAHRRIPVLEEDNAVIAQHLRKALHLDPSIAKTFLDLAAARCAPGPEVLTTAQQRNLSSPHRLLLQHGWRWDYLDIELLQALGEVLEEAGQPAEQQIHRWLLQHHDVSHRPRDLCRAPYLWQPLERLYPEVMDTEASRRATFRGAWPRVSFCLIASGQRDVILDPVLRLPAIPGATSSREGEVKVHLNGVSLNSLSVDSSWSRCALRLPREQLHPAINRLTLEWPPLPAVGDEAYAEAVQQLEMGREADLHPIFGEIYSLVARVA